MDGNKCTKCGKVINNNTFTRCEDCWITVSPSEPQPGKPISRKETLKMSSAILTQAEKERYRQPDELFDYTKELIIKLNLDIKKVESNALVKTEELENRIIKLETSLENFDELFDDFNLQALKAHSDFEGRIKALETELCPERVPFQLGVKSPPRDNLLPWSERVSMLSINPDAASRNDIARMAAELMEPQARNPLSKESLLYLLGWIYPDNGEKLSAFDMELKQQLKSYRGE